uniref:Variant surface glycoprotein 1125.2661 n=1 Tax=Trypanosoma brucei TaxID=5691 RepID=M4SVL6_9TRYP|nr:variant surface glycoprotein 1140 [Trypanosoma brucei]APD74125.1 variant surface glycoprotein 1125.2661 [Trypanosoma brucei]
MTPILSHLYIVVLTVQTLETVSAENIQAAENPQVFSDLCDIVATAEGGLQLPTISDTAEADCDYIQKLNMTVAKDSWQKMFIEKYEPLKVLDDTDKANQKNKGYNKLWPTWKKAVEAVKAKEEDAEIKDSRLKNLKGAVTLAARNHLAVISAAAAAAMQEAGNTAAQKDGLSDTSVSDLLKEAAYGDKAATETTYNVQSIFGAATTGARTAACSTGTAEPAARPKTVLAALMCCCYEDQTTGVDEVCFTGLSITTAWNGGTTAPATTDMQKISKKCGKHPTDEATSAVIERLLQGVKRLITTADSDGYLGAYHATGCNGQNSGGICVKIAKYKTDGESALKKLPWYSKLLDLKIKLEDREAKAAAAPIRSQFLRQLRNKAASVSSAVEIPISTEKNDETEKNSKKTEAKACGTHNTNSTCTTDNNCKWEENASDKSKGTCKPKDGEDQKTQGTGKQAGVQQHMDVQDTELIR